VIPPPMVSDQSEKRGESEVLSSRRKSRDILPYLPCSRVSTQDRQEKHEDIHLRDLPEYGRENEHRKEEHLAGTYVRLVFLTKRCSSILTGETTLMTVKLLRSERAGKWHNQLKPDEAAAEADAQYITTWSQARSDQL
jgi:hypothetical protein